MFIGHFAVALASKRAAPAVSLGVLFAACQLADLIWPNLVLAGVERVDIAVGHTAVTPLRFSSYPFSHSLVALSVWATIAAVLYRLLRHSTFAAALTVSLVVLSHWVLDAVSHAPDMPILVSGGHLVGLGLWRSVPATVVVEWSMLAVGVLLYIRTTRPTDRVGSVGFWSLIGFLLVVNVLNLAGPPPPSTAAVAWTAQSLWLIVLWAFWVDRHRTTIA
jgi:hypothetical protein